jgi:hypothetical protein
MSDREFWALVRQALLMFVDAIERRYLPDMTRTAEARRMAKQANP